MSEIDADRIDAAGTEWLRLQQAADYLGVNDRTVRNWVKGGSLPAYRIRGSRLLLIKISDLDNALVPVAGEELQGEAND